MRLATLTALLLMPVGAQAATFTNICTDLGVTLPVLQSVDPVAGGLLTGLLSPVTNVLNTVVGQVDTNVVTPLSGKAIGLGAFNAGTGQYQSLSAAACNLSANAFALNNSLGLSLGGGQISGLGGNGGIAAVAGDATAIAFGNGASTAAAAANAIAFGTGAAVTAANSVALGANATATRGALGAYNAFGLTALQTSTGEVSFGALGALRQLTNVAAGSNPTDAVNLSQLTGAASNLGSSIATGLGAGATYNALTGQITAPAYTIGGHVYGDIGAALNAASALGVLYTPNLAGNPTAAIDLTKGGALSAVTLSGLAAGTIANGSQQAVNGGQLFAATQFFQSNSALATAAASGLNSLAVGPAASTSAAAVNGVAIGTGATATAVGGIALGAGSVAARAAQTYVDPFSGASLTTVVGAVSLGQAGQERQLTNLAAGSLSTDAVNVGQLTGALAPLQSIGKLSLGYVADANGNPTAVINLVGNTGLPAGTTQSLLTGVAPGALAALSKDAVNGAELFATGNTLATALGGGAVLDPVTGSISTPHFNINGGVYTTVGSALGALSGTVSSITSGTAGLFVADNTAGAASSIASGLNSVAGGFGAAALGAASTVIGDGASDAGVAASTVLGNGASVVAGLPGSNVALGRGSIASIGSRAAYSAFGLLPLQSSAGEVSVGAVGAVRQLTNLAAGTLSTDAVNVAQLQGASSLLGSSISTLLGGGSAYNALTGQVSSLGFTVGSTVYGTIGGAISALNTTVGSLPVQYSTAAAPTVANPGVRSNDVTLVGANAAVPVALHNVAAGALSAGSTDAATAGQVFAGNQSLATILGGGATYNTTTGAVTNPTYTVQGTAYTTIGSALNALSGSINGTGNQLYFQANSALGNAAATAANAVAIGPLAVASGVSAVALGNGAVAAGVNSVALGAGSTDGGLNNVVSVGAVGAERRIVNVAAGALTATSTDAVNGSQLAATNSRIAAVGHAAIQYATDAAGNTLSSVTLSSDQGGPVIIHNLAPGVAPTDAATVQQVEASSSNAVQYGMVNGVRSNTIALAGGAQGGVTISNLAAGIAATDAVNVAQLQSASAGAISQANAYTDGQINNLAAFTQKQISAARSDAAGGTAVALAAAGLRYEDAPGKASVGGAVAYYGGQMGMAFGVGQTTENGRYRMNAAMTASPTMSSFQVGVVVGASMSLN